MNISVLYLVSAVAIGLLLGFVVIVLSLPSED